MNESQNLITAKTKKPKATCHYQFISIFVLFVSSCSSCKAFYFLFYLFICVHLRFKNHWPLIRDSISAFCTCRRFSASSIATQ